MDNIAREFGTVAVGQVINASKTKYLCGTANDRASLGRRVTIDEDNLKVVEDFV